MSNTFLFILALIVFTVFNLVATIMIDKPRVVVYDCRLSEISPDFPPDVREQCRKLRATSGRI